MSIATDVSRIKGNINAALAAIADKGVTVPAGSTSDALAGLIASIEAGGGGSGAESGEWACGTYTPSETIIIGTKSHVTIETGLSSIRFFAFLYNQTVSTSAAFEYVMAVWDYNGGNYHGYRIARPSNGGLSGMSVGATINNEYVGDTMFAEGGTMKFSGASSSTKVVAGNTYVWFAIGG